MTKEMQNLALQPLFSSTESLISGRRTRGRCYRLTRRQAWLRLRAGRLEAAKTRYLTCALLFCTRSYAGYGLPQAVDPGRQHRPEAVRRFNPEVGVRTRVSASPVHWIKAEIHEYVLRNWRSGKSLRRDAEGINVAAKPSSVWELV